MKLLGKLNNFMHKGLILAILFLLLSIHVQGAPSLIGYSGQLRDADGTLISGTESITFRLFSVVSGGSALWSEAQDVSLQAGEYNIFLGSLNAFDASVFQNQELWIEMEINGEILSPRKRLPDFAYAIQAQAANAVAPNSVTGESFAPGAIGGEKLQGGLGLEKLTACGESSTLVMTTDGLECRAGKITRYGDLQGCYSGPAATVNIGECKSGLWQWDGAAFGPCIGEALPGTEVCNGLDDDCTGLVDDNLTPPVASNQIGVCAGSLKTCSGSSGWIDKYLGLPNYQPVELNCDGLDNDCDGVVDEGCPCDDGNACTLEDFISNSGVCMPGTLKDCSDGDLCTEDMCEVVTGACVNSPVQNPDIEVCDGIDNDCDGVVDEGCEDGDGDGSIAMFDCDDANPDKFPGQVWYPDCDGDSFFNYQLMTSCDEPLSSCSDLQPPDGGWSHVDPAGNGDCNDESFAEFPGQVWYPDCDGDGYFSVNFQVSCAEPPSNCSDFQLPDGGWIHTDPLGSADCEDELVANYPGNSEVCDGLDNDCSLVADDNLTPGQTSSQLGVCLGAVQTCTGVGGWVDDYSSITGWEATETLCDGQDNDCDGEVDEGCPAILLISEYLDSSSNSDALEITNIGYGTTGLGTCSIKIYNNGATNPSYSYSPSGFTMGHNESYVLCRNNMHPSCDQTWSNLQWDGNDAIELSCGTSSIDIIGRIGQNPPGGYWGTTTTTKNTTLRRKCTVTEGDSVGSDNFDPALEWDGFTPDLYNDLGQYNCP